MIESFNKLFYISASPKDIELLKHDEYGVYIRLLEYMWKCCGKLPNNDTEIAHYLRITPKKWQNYKKILQNFFIFSDRTFTHFELKQEYQKAQLKSQQNTLKAQKRWGVQSSDVTVEKTAIETQNYHANGYAIALPLHMQWQCYTRASIRLKDIDNRLDDGLGLPKIVDNFAQLEELQTQLIALFVKHNMLLPQDGALLSKWLGNNLSSKTIYQKIERVIKRINKKGLSHPKSFAYFEKEIESGQ